jgi:hypothetical protein
MPKKQKFSEGLSISHRDWRLQAITTLSSPWTGFSGEQFPVGTPVELQQLVRLSSGLVATPVPNAAALYLSLATKAASESQRLRVEIGTMLEPSAGSAKQRIPNERDQIVFDYYEQILACVIFSYSSVEAFANEQLPNDYSYSRVRNDRRCSEVYEKQQIERYIALDEKLHSILPELRKVRTPKGTKHWESFVKLTELRNSFVHLKESDWRTSSVKEAENLIWNRAIRLPYEKAPQQMAELIKHYFPDSLPRWLAKFAA